MTKLKIFDVGHGCCALAVARDGATVLFDCGHKSDPEYRPSAFLPSAGVQRITYFVVTNYDEDHMSDLHNLRQVVNIDILSRNPTITAEELKALKEEGGPITSAMDSLLDMIKTYTGGPLSPPPSMPGLTWTTYYNSYGTQFDDTNNISVVTILNAGGLRVCLPGDVETAGWDKLLQNPTFTSELANVNVFVASHHGRENGYHEGVLGIAQPDVVVFSDGPKQHATQEMTDVYAKHASGVTFNATTRKVLTTRNDGSIYWDWQSVSGR